MKQKFTNKISRLLKISFLVSFLMMEFFGVTFFAQAAGSVTFTVQVSSTSVKDGETLKVTPKLPTIVGQNGATIKTFVNGQQVGNLPGVDLDPMFTATVVVQDIKVSTQTGFKNGTNYITVTIINPLDSSVYGSQNAVVTYTGQTPPAITSGSVCQVNSGCASQGVGFICNSSKTCVEASDFSCNNGNSAICPSGLKCINNSCLESCSGGSCSWADETCDTKTGSPTYQYCTTSSGAGPTAPPTAPGSPAIAGNSGTELYNPIQGVNDLTKFVVNIMQGFLAIIAVWAVAFIVIGGFRMVISQGNEESLLAAKKTITWAVLGLLVAVLSFAIIAIVQNLIGYKVPPS